MSKMNILCEHTIVIPWLPCLFSMAVAVSSTVERVNSVTSHSVNLINLAMCTFASKCFPFEPVPFPDRWWRTWWQRIQMMPGMLSVSNSSRLSVWVRVQVQTEPLPYWRSGLWLNPNRQLGYRSMVNSQPVWIGRAVRGLPSGPIQWFI